MSALAILAIIFGVCMIGGLFLFIFTIDYSDLVPGIGAGFFVAGVIGLLYCSFAEIVRDGNITSRAEAKAEAACHHYVVDKLNRDRDGYYVFTCKGGPNKDKVLKVKR